MPQGNWIETYTGRKFYPIDPDPDDINIEDIAHALSLICRFNGHCRFFYSVAQHSLGVQEELAREGYSKVYQLYGLLHDAAEAYLADVISPVKPHLVNYEDLEKRLLANIFKKFGLLPLSGRIWAYRTPLKYFDAVMLNAEARALMCNTDNWAGRLPRIERNIIFEDPGAVEQRFLMRFRGLREMVE